MAAFLSRHAWVIPLAFALAFSVATVSAIRTLERHERDSLQSQVDTTVAATVEALKVWRRENEAAVRVQLANPLVRESVLELLAISRRSDDVKADLLASPALERLRSIVDPGTGFHGFISWGAQDLSGLMFANKTDDMIGQSQVLRGGNAVPRAGEVFQTAPIAVERGDGLVSLMIVGGAVTNDAGNVVALFGFSRSPSSDFRRILEVGRLGESGETYAFDATGVMVSPSRFEDQLRRIGVLPADDPEQGAALYVEIRDPGGDMATGYRPDLPVKARPLTKAAASAISGESGSDIEGYPDYRGVPVIGAWAWIPELQIGIASEIDVAEAYAGLWAVQLRLYVLIGLLLVAAIGMGVYSLVVSRLQGKVQQARQLGRYRVERQLGQGGMGTVYLARHALLRRPTAVKVLEKAAAGGESAQRFEREVQVSSALTHPNTIEIYDYGKTPSGDFYYAMEYVEGLTLSHLIEKD